MAKNEQEQANEVNILIGDLLEIEKPDGGTIKTKVEDISGTEMLAIDFLHEVIWIEDWKEQAFSIRFVRGDRCFAFLGYVAGNKTVEGHKMTRVVRISPVEEVQRRIAYRLKYIYDVYTRLADSEEEFTKSQGLDISETGIGLNAEIKWNVGEEVECMFKIKGEEYRFFAKIVRRLDWVMGGQYIYRVGLEFADEDERQMRRIRRFIYTQQIARDQG